MYFQRFTPAFKTINNQIYQTLIPYKSYCLLNISNSYESEVNLKKKDYNIIIEKKNDIFRLLNKPSTI